MTEAQAIAVLVRHFPGVRLERHPPQLFVNHRGLAVCARCRRSTALVDKDDRPLHRGCA